MLWYAYIVICLFNCALCTIVCACAFMRHPVVDFVEIGVNKQWNYDDKKETMRHMTKKTINLFFRTVYSEIFKHKTSWQNISKPWNTNEVINWSKIARNPKSAIINMKKKRRIVSKMKRQTKRTMFGEKQKKKKTETKTKCQSEQAREMQTNKGRSRE